MSSSLELVLALALFNLSYAFPTTIVGFWGFGEKSILPTLSKLVARNKGAYDYLAESIAAWPKQEVLVDWLSEAGFTNAKYKNLSLGIVALHTAQKEAK